VAWLLIVGAILEFGGIALVGADVVDASRERRRLSRPDVLVQPSPAEATAVTFPPTLAGADPASEQSPEQRLQQLEREAILTRRKLDAMEEQAKRDQWETQERVAAWVAEARRETWQVGTRAATADR
jgi:hypothetical protein